MSGFLIAIRSESDSLRKFLAFSSGLILVIESSEHKTTIILLYGKFLRLIVLVTHFSKKKQSSKSR